MDPRQSSVPVFQMSFYIQKYFHFLLFSGPMTYMHAKHAEVSASWSVCVRMWKLTCYRFCILRFHSVWLRHNCHCNHCRQEHSGQKLIDPATVPHTICIEEVHLRGRIPPFMPISFTSIMHDKVNDFNQIQFEEIMSQTFPDDQLEIKWNGEESSHNGSIALTYLLANCYSADSLRARREAVKLDSHVQVCFAMQEVYRVKDSLSMNITFSIK